MTSQNILQFHIGVLNAYFCFNIVIYWMTMDIVVISPIMWFIEPLKDNYERSHATTFSFQRKKEYALYFFERACTLHW